MPLDIDMISLNKKIRIGLGFSLLILISASAISYYCITKLIDSSKWVDHTNAVLVKLENISTLLNEAEAGIRGYALTKSPDFLDFYDGNKNKVFIDLQEIRTLTNDNPGQQIRTDTLEDWIRKKYIILDLVIRTRTISDVHPQVFRDGKSAMDKIKSSIISMREHEEMLLKRRTSEFEKFTASTPILILFLSLISICIALISFYFINKDLVNKALAERELSFLNARLSESNEDLLKKEKELFRRNYILAGLTEFNELVRKEIDVIGMGKSIIRHLCEYTNAQVGIIYILQEDTSFHYSGAYALEIDGNVPLEIRPGEGLLGQVALNQKMQLLSEIPHKGVKMSTGILSIEANNVMLIPFSYNGETVAVAEIINKGQFLELEVQYLEAIGDNVCIMINRLKSEIKTLALLEETQTQSEELEAQQEELRQTNEELRAQSSRLEASEEELKANEEELQEKNAELEEKANELEEQYETLRYKNTELEDAKDVLKLQMEQIQQVSKYKSEFLANMSHELRTPLNSILILSKILKDNRHEHLSQKEKEHAEVIHKSGNDLLRLINEILDLARIESGKVKLEPHDINPQELHLQEQFNEVASQKNIDFKIVYADNLPTTIYTDRFRLEQVLKNLLSNAFKFTGDRGRVELNIFIPKKDALFNNANLIGNPVIGFAVQDTGIGIPAEKMQLIFEAFQQADNSTTRKYGGTGLGLSISRELAFLLGGEIQVQSTEQEGSKFTLYIPQRIDPEPSIAKSNTPVQGEVTPSNYVSPVLSIRKETKARPNNEERRKSIVIVEDDNYFRKILEDYAQERNYIVHSTDLGEEGIRLALEHVPDAVLLDIQLPDISGWEVLGRIKNIEKLKHIPVHVMSAYDKEINTKNLGQADFLSKPISLEVLDKAFNEISNVLSKPLQKILVVEDNEVENNAIKELLNTQDLVSDGAMTGTDALRMLQENNYDCVILDISLPDIGGYEVLRKIRSVKKFKDIPVVIYSGKDLTEGEEARFKKYTNTIIIKTDYSYTRLLEEVKLFLHNFNSNLNQKISYGGAVTHKNGEQLKGKKVLLVDDDIRNIYSLNDLLENEGMNVVVAYDGRQALHELEQNSDVDIILMDVMMPEMDGIEATKSIRSNPKHKNLPILALTAKAMKGDREKCIEAGASDYIPKPVDVDKLLSLMRVWLYNKANKFI